MPIVPSNSQNERRSISDVTDEEYLASLRGGLVRRAEYSAEVARREKATAASAGSLIDSGRVDSLNPVDAMRGTAEIMRGIEAEQRRHQLTRAPALANFIGGSPLRAASVQDSVGALADFERWSVTRLPERGQRNPLGLLGEIGGELTDAPRSILSGLVLDNIGGVVSAAGGLLRAGDQAGDVVGDNFLSPIGTALSLTSEGLIGEARTRAIESRLSDLGNSETMTTIGRSFAPFAATLDGVGDLTGDALIAGGGLVKDLSDWVAPDENGLEDQIFRGVGQLVGAVAVTVVAGPEATAGMFGALGVDQQADRMRAEGVDLELTPMLAGGGWTMVTEQIRLGRMIEVLPPNLRNHALARLLSGPLGARVGRVTGEALEEGVQEAIEGIGHNLIARLYDSDAQIFSGWANDMTVAGASAAIFQTVAEAAIPGRARGARTEGARSLLDSMHEAVQSAPVVQRSRRTVEDYINEATDDATINVSPEGVVALYQTEDGLATLRDLGLTDDQISTAIAFGADTEISVARLMTSDGYDVIADHLRVSGDDFTTSQLSEGILNEVASVDVSEAARAISERVEGGESVDAVSGAVADQLIAAGRPEQEARAAGAVWGAAMDTLSSLTGVPPAQIFDTLNMNIQRARADGGSYSQATKVNASRRRNARAAGFLQEATRGAQANPFNSRESVIGNPLGGVEISIGSGGTPEAHINSLRAVQRGGGRAAITRLINAADRMGVDLTVFAESFDSTAGKKMSKAALAKWYKQFGFINDGDGYMRRPAQPVATLNVGLNVGKEVGALDLQKIRDNLPSDVTITEEATLQIEEGESPQEPTFVAQLSRALTPVELDELSKATGRGAIAQVFGEDGSLHGQKAADWGPFNPRFFHFMGGKTMFSSFNLTRTKDILVDFLNNDGQIPLVFYAGDVSGEVDVNDHQNDPEFNTPAVVERQGKSGFLPRAYLGIGVGHVGGYSNANKAGVPHQGVVDPEKIYPIEVDPLMLEYQASDEFPLDDGEARNRYEELIKAAGYTGYFGSSKWGPVLVSFENIPVTPVANSTFNQSGVPITLEPLAVALKKGETTIRLRHIADALTRRHKEKYGAMFEMFTVKGKGAKAKITLNDEQFDIVKAAMVEEVRFQMEQGEGDAGVWYTEDVAEALETTSTVIPELKTGIDGVMTAKTVQDLLLSFAALTSPNSNPITNWDMATEVLRRMLDDPNYRVPLRKANPDGTPKINATGENAGEETKFGLASDKALPLAQYMIDTFGFAGFVEFMQTPHSAREFAEIRRQSGVYKAGQSNSQYTPKEVFITDPTPYAGSWIFGPKVGEFMMNATGYDQNAVTVDVWNYRTYARLTGRLKFKLSSKEADVGITSGDALDRNVRAVIARLETEVAAEFENLSPSAVQALLWFFEQRLYREHGSNSASYTFSDGARTAVAKYKREHPGRYENDGARTFNQDEIIPPGEPVDFGSELGAPRPLSQEEGKVAEAEFTAAQGQYTVDELLEMAPAMTAQLTADLISIADRLGLGVVTAEHKKRARIEEKIEQKKYQSTSKLGDINRGTLLVDSVDQYFAAINALAEKYDVLDEGWATTMPNGQDGYFDAKVIVRFANGVLGEVQLMPPTIFNAKHNLGGHLFYEAWRDAFKDGNENSAAIMADMEAKAYELYTSALQESPYWLGMREILTAAKGKVSSQTLLSSISASTMISRASTSSQAGGENALNTNPLSGGPPSGSTTTAGLFSALRKYLITMDGVSSSTESVAEGPTVYNNARTFNQPERKRREGYVGAPVRFTKFDRAYVGTGEGQHIFGWGFYSAEAIQVAREYYNRYKGAAAKYTVPPMNDPLRPWVSELEKKLKGVATSVFVHTGSRDSGLYINVDRIDDAAGFARIVDDALGELSGDERFDTVGSLSVEAARGMFGPLSDGSLEVMGDPRAEGKGALVEVLIRNRNGSSRVMKSGYSSAVVAVSLRPIQEGGLHKVEFNDGVFLDWDKPISEQSAEIQAFADHAIENLIPHDKGNADVIARLRSSGEALYRALALHNGGQEAVSRLMHAAGITGNKYLDGFSRQKKEGGTYNYVIFDEADIDVVDNTLQQSRVKPDADGVTRVNGREYGPQREGETLKEYMKREIDTRDAPTDLPFEPEKFFDLSQPHEMVPVDQIISSKSDEENQKGGSNAPKRFLAAYDGILTPRGPITVSRNQDGTYTVIDGNGTLTAFKGYGWESIPVEVAPNNVSVDNPGGRWLEHQREDAAASRRSTSGAVTANTKQHVLFPVDKLMEIPGHEGEQRGPGDHQYDALLASVEEKGFLQDAPILVGVNHDGVAYIIEGNTRAAVAKAKGIESIPAEVRWFAGGETVATDITIDYVNSLERVEKPTTLQQDEFSAPNVNSKEFKEWFGAGQVVDENGAPLAVYHFTTVEGGFSAFKPLSHFGTQRAAKDRYYATVDRDVYSGTDDGAEGSTIPAYLSIQNALVLGRELIFDDGAPTRSAWQNDNDMFRHVAFALRAHGHEDGAAEIERLVEAGPDDFSLIPGAVANSHRSAIKVLEGLGFDGLKYINDAEDPGSESWVAFRPGQIKSAIANTGAFKGDEILRQDEDENGPRANVTIPGGGVMTDREVVVRLTKAADATSFMHESAHIFLEIYSALEDSHPAVAEIMTDIREWLGIVKGQKITEAQHEQFAEAFEKYMMEGKAPTARLKEPFAQFRRWFSQVYRHLRGQLTALPPEAKSIFDRMLAADTALERESTAAQIDRVADALKGIMTDEEITKHEKLIARARNEAIENITKRVAEKIERANRAEVRAARARIKAEVTAEVDADPVFTTIEAITNKGGEQLNRAAVEAVLTKEQIARLPRGKRGLLTDAGGVTDLDAYAEDNGFLSASGMLGRMVGSNGRAVEINARLEAGAEKAGVSLMTDAEIDAAAIAATFTKGGAEIMDAELNALSRKAAIKGIPLSAIRDEAKRRIETGVIADVVKPGIYAVRSRSLHRQALRAAARGDWKGAARFMQQALLAHEMSRLAYLARTEIEKGARRVSRFRPNKALNPKAYDPAFIEIIHTAYGLPGSKTSVEDGKKVADFLDDKELNDVPIMTAVALGRAVPAHREMTLEEFREWRDMLVSIGKKARDSQSAMRGERAKAIQALAEAIEDNGGNSHAQTEMGDESEQELKNRPLNFIASLRRLPFLVRLLDGGPDKTGAAYKAIIEPLREASNNALEMKNANQDWFQDFFKKYSAVLEFDKSVYSDVLGLELTGQQIFAILSNTGNESNRARLLSMPALQASVRDKKVPFFSGGEAQLQAFIDEMGTPERMDAVQSLWDYINSYWPAISEQQRRTTGVRPKKVEATPVTAQGKTYRGGYYPLAYDPNTPGADPKSGGTEDTANNVRAYDDAKVKSGVLVRASTRQGHTIERAKGVQRRLLLSIDVATRHLDNVAHDLAFREVFSDLWGAFTNPKVELAIKNALGVNNYRAMKTMIQRVVAGQNVPQAFFGKLLRSFRTKATTALLGLNVRVVLTQPLALTQAYAKLGGKQMSAALGEYISDPIGTVEMIQKKSLYMKNRGRVLNRDIKEMLRENRQQTHIERLRVWSMWFMQKTDMYGAAAPTWLAAYRMKLDEGATDREASLFADTAVSDTQGSGEEMDLSTMQSGEETEKMFSFMYGYFSGTFNLSVEAIQNIRGGKVGRGVSQLFTIHVIQGALAMILMNGLPDDDDDDGELVDDYLAAIGMGTLENAIGSVPLAREFWSATKFGSGQETSLGRFLGTAVRTGQGGADIVHDYFVEGEVEADKVTRFAINALRTAGLATGLPTYQGARLLDATLLDDSPSAYEILVSGRDRGDD